MPKPEPGFKKKWNRIWKKFNDNRKIYLHTLKIIILRNKGLILAFITQLSLFIYTSVLLTTEHIEILKVQKYNCNIEKNQPNSSTDGTCSDVEVGSIHFKYKKALIDFTYFYSEFSPYINPSLKNDSLEEIKKLENNDVKQKDNPKINKNFPYEKSETKGNNNEEKYIVIFPFERCFDEIAIFGQPNKTSSGGCDLNVIGSLLYLVTIFLLLSICVVLIGLSLYARSLFLWSPKHKFTLAFSFVTLFMLILNAVLLFMFSNEVVYNIGAFSTIFNSFMVTRNSYTFLKLSWVEMSLIFTIIQIITIYIIMGIYTTMTPEKKKYRDNYEFLMNQKRYLEEVSSVTESTDAKINEIY